MRFRSIAALVALALLLAAVGSANAFLRKSFRTGSINFNWESTATPLSVSGSFTGSLLTNTRLTGFGGTAPAMPTESITATAADASSTNCGGAGGCVQLTVAATGSFGATAATGLACVKFVNGTGEANGCWPYYVVSATAVDLQGSTYQNPLTSPQTPALATPIVGIAYGAQTVTAVAGDGTTLCGGNPCFKLTVGSTANMTTGDAFSTFGLGDGPAGMWPITVVDSTHIVLGTWVSFTGSIASGTLTSPLGTLQVQMQVSGAGISGPLTITSGPTGAGPYTYTTSNGSLTVGSETLQVSVQPGPPETSLPTPTANSIIAVNELVIGGLDEDSGYDWESVSEYVTFGAVMANRNGINAVDCGFENSTFTAATKQTANLLHGTDGWVFQLIAPASGVNGMGSLYCYAQPVNGIARNAAINVFIHNSPSGANYYISPCISSTPTTSCLNGRPVVYADSTNGTADSGACPTWATTGYGSNTRGQSPTNAFQTLTYAIACVPNGGVVLVANTTGNSAGTGICPGASTVPAGIPGDQCYGILYGNPHTNVNTLPIMVTPNPVSSGGMVAVSSVSWSSGTLTLTLASPIPGSWGIGTTVQVTGMFPLEENGQFVLTAVGTNTISYACCQVGLFLGSNPATYHPGVTAFMGLVSVPYEIEISSSSTAAAWSVPAVLVRLVGANIDPATIGGTKGYVTGTATAQPWSQGVTLQNSCMWDSNGYFGAPAGYYTTELVGSTNDTFQTATFYPASGAYQVGSWEEGCFNGALTMGEAAVMRNIEAYALWVSGQSSQTDALVQQTWLNVDSKMPIVPSSGLTALQQYTWPTAGMIKPAVSRLTSNPTSDSLSPALGACTAGNVTATADCMPAVAAGVTVSATGSITTGSASIPATGIASCTGLTTGLFVFDTGPTGLSAPVKLGQLAIATPCTVSTGLTLAANSAASGSTGDVIAIGTVELNGGNTYFSMYAGSSATYVGEYNGVFLSGNCIYSAVLTNGATAAQYLGNIAFNTAPTAGLMAIELFGDWTESSGGICNTTGVQASDQFWMFAHAHSDFPHILEAANSGIGIIDANFLMERVAFRAIGLAPQLQTGGWSAAAGSTISSTGMAVTTGGNASALLPSVGEYVKANSGSIATGEYQERQITQVSPTFSSGVGGAGGTITCQDGNTGQICVDYPFSPNLSAQSWQVGNTVEGYACVACSVGGGNQTGINPESNTYGNVTDISELQNGAENFLFLQDTYAYWEQTMGYYVQTSNGLGGGLRAWTIYDSLLGAGCIFAFSYEGSCNQASRVPGTWGYGGVTVETAGNATPLTQVISTGSLLLDGTIFDDVNLNIVVGNPTPVTGFQPGNTTNQPVVVNDYNLRPCSSTSPSVSCANWSVGQFTTTVRGLGGNGCPIFPWTTDGMPVPCSALIGAMQP